MKTIVGLLIVVVALLSVMLFHAYEPTKPEQWSYVVFAPKDETLADQLNSAGALGYELVTARRASDGNETKPTFSYEVILKRHGAAPITSLK